MISLAQLSEELRWGSDRDSAPPFELEQMAVAGDDGVHIALGRRFEHTVVGSIRRDDLYRCTRLDDLGQADELRDRFLRALRLPESSSTPTC